MYANFHKPSLRTLKRHLFLVEIAKKLIFRQLKILAVSAKADEFKQERMFGRVEKIPIGSTLNE